MTSCAIHVEELTRTFTTGRRANRRTVEAVRGISLDVEAGERIAFIGPNGAGKSTSIKILTGILHPTSGRAQVLGITPWEHRKRLAARIGTLFGQRSMLWQELPARHSYRMLAAIHGIERDDAAARVDDLAALLDATDLVDSPVRTLSLGQRMRCELVACLLHRPEILFLDEPTIGLDLLAKQRFRELLVRINEQRGTTVFLTSHDIADIEVVARRAVVVNHGTVVADDAVDALRRTLLSTKLVDAGLTRPMSIGHVELPGVEIVEHSDVSLKLVVDTSRVSVRTVLDALLDGPAVGDITVTDPPLEDVIAELYQSAPA